MSDPPRFSVIIPLEFHRGQAIHCVRGWAEGQLFPREQFEIVVASPTCHRTAELAEIRGLLGPQDRVLEFDRHHDMDLCAKAAESASGEVLFFTESHCLPEPETLASADDVMRENPEWAGFSCRSIPITGNLLSEIEAEWYGRDIDFGMNEHPWRKVLDQCFVVRRSAYFQSGGFDPAFGHFAEWLIAARFYALGLKIGYAPSVRIHHLYIGEFGEWHRFTADFLQGQMAYLALEPGDPLITMFDEVPEWSRRHMLRRSVARRVCRMLLRDLRRSIAAGSATHPRRSLSALRHWQWWLLRSWLVRAVAGHSIVLMRAQRRQFTTRVALQVDLLTRNRARAEVDIGRCCEAIATVERTRFLRTWTRNLERDEASSPSLDDAPAGDFGLWQAGRPDEANFVGFYAASPNGAEAVRWSEPAAYVELPLAAGRYVMTLNWLFPPRVDGEPRLRFYLDERPIPAENVSIRHDFAELHVDVRESSSPTRLGWVCPAIRADNDERAFGLAVISLAWAREEAHTSHVGERTTDAVELARLT
ncbi:MAG: hypothetical protein EHM63_03460 [Actinobacteria bacterium]|nr:MAG: hypothetical protein EHM63_03460 [Actinomycetota bacterium]